MGDIYDDLENYEQENIIKELRNENKELKCKLEVYAVTLDTLQKDFDKLSAEYKKLELNYSSLLKTARAEIERKTTIITNLHVEKDKLVIDALQNRGRVHTNHQNKTINKSNTQPAKGAGCEKGKNETSISNESYKTLGTVRNDRKDTGLNAGSFSTEKTVKPISAKNERGNDNDKSKNKESKENHLHDFVEEKGKDQVKKIHDRRKSMPLLNRGDFKFSSDEEQEDNPRERFERDRFKRKASSRDFNERKYDNNRTGRSAPKVDDKYSSYHDLSRDYRKSYSHHSENDRYRIKDNRDRYDSYHRSRRHSPDRSRYNTRKEYSNERPYRTDTVGHRVLESPPPDRYCQYRRSSRDVDWHRFQYEETMKHKTHDVIEEPVCKRMRTESFNRQSDEHINLLPDRDIGIHSAGTQPPQYSYLYLQSPDYVHLESYPVHQIKEIMPTATTDLDDPRLKSNKYVFKTHQDKVTLSTVVGRDVDMKLVDETTWVKNKDKDNLQRMPTPLREKPQTMEDLVKDIYMDIDNPILNLSLESGEVVYSDDDLMISNVNKNISESDSGVANIGVANENVINTGGVKVTIEDTGMTNADVAITSVANTGLANIGGVNTTAGNTSKDNADVANKGVAATGAATLKTHVKCHKPVINNIQGQHQIQVNKMPIPNPIDNINKPPSLFKKYTIPKINKPNTHKPLEDVITNIMHKLDKKEQCQKDKGDKETKVKEKSTQKEFDIHNPLKLFSSAKQICETKTKDRSVDVRRRKYPSEKVTSSARDTVEGDLELSDETSDCTEFTDQIRYNKEKIALTSECTNKPVIDIAHKDTHDSGKNSSNSMDKQREDLKHGIETMFDNKHTNIQVTLPEVKLQESKPCNEGLKDKTQDMKTKLCDLFGDSSSLITPDDLGIVEPPITNQVMNDYIPLFDNTQDAIDLNIDEMEKVQTRSLKKEFDKVVVNNVHQDSKQDKKQKNKANKTNEGKKKSKNNCDKKTIAEAVIKNCDAEVLNEELNVVKTIIISTGVQNNCHPEDLVLDKGKEGQSLAILGKVDNNVPNCQPLPCLKALATSTPHKITQIETTLSVPGISCNANNLEKDIGTSSSSKNIDKTTQDSTDVPDVRIIIKRRRKGRANAS